MLVTCRSCAGPRNGKLIRGNGEPGLAAKIQCRAWLFQLPAAMPCFRKLHCILIGMNFFGSLILV